jgi:hypothetical protein
MANASYSVQSDKEPTVSVRKVSYFSSCENLVGFNEAHLHEATLNLNTYA